MKRCILTLAAVLIVAASVSAAPPLAITNYFSQAIVIPSVTNVGLTGLATGRVYIAFSVPNITTTEYTAALVTNDVRATIGAIVKKLDVQLAAETNTTKQFTSFGIDETLQWTTATNRVIYRTISEGQSFTLTPSYPAQ
jgi:hypothetical protein